MVRKRWEVGILWEVLCSKTKGCKCAQEVLLVVAAEEVFFQAPKGRPVEMPEY